MLIDSTRHYLRCWVFAFKTDDAVAVSFFKELKFGIIGIHAECVIIGFKEIANHATNEFEIKNHLSLVECIRLKNKLHLARVSVRKTALIGVLGEEVAVFDLDHFANSVGHGEGSVNAEGGIARLIRLETFVE